MSRISKALRNRIRRRACGLCEYCHSMDELTGHDFTVDHVLPLSIGGRSQYENLSWCCFWCNCFKQARTHSVDPRSGLTIPLFNPRTEIWTEHFRWSRDGVRIIGRTASGRATVDALQLNRLALVLVRRLWVRHNLHPAE